MVQNQKSKKPKVIISTAAFSKNGEVQLLEETLPRTQSDADKWAVENFISSLKTKANFELKISPEKEEPADVICETTSGEVIKIQVTEAVDLLNRSLEEVRYSYTQAIASDRSLVSSFSGCKITLSDNGERPVLPPIKTRFGEIALREIKDQLLEFAQELSHLESGKIYIRKWNIGRDNIVVHCVCKFYGLPEMKTSISWSGARVVKSMDEDVLFIRNAIQQKINKNYSKPQEEFWLLVYGANLPPIALDADYKASKYLLTQKENPFDKVWFLYPIASLGKGILHLIWER